MKYPLLFFAVVGIAGCARDMGGWFEPPLRRTVRLGPISPYFRSLVNMNDPGAEMSFEQDIEPHLQAGAWRWCGRAPALKVQLRSIQNQKLIADFTIPESGFAQTGPVQVAITVNGRRLTVVNCDRPGPQHVEQPVPADWLATAVDNHILLEVSKPWRRSGVDHDYGLVLTRAGFRQ